MMNNPILREIMEFTTAETKTLFGDSLELLVAFDTKNEPFYENDADITFGLIADVTDAQLRANANTLYDLFAGAEAKHDFQIILSLQDFTSHWSRRYYSNPLNVFHDYGEGVVLYERAKRVCAAASFEVEPMLA
jgi:hypothetical protein